MEPDQAVSPSDAKDALAEFLNILTGALLVEAGADAPTGASISGVPEMMALRVRLGVGKRPRPGRLARFLAQSGTVVFSAEGHVVACRVARETAGVMATIV